MGSFERSRAVLGAALASTLLAAAPAHAEVGVSVTVSRPGVYGRVDIGRFPTPQVVLPQPVVVQRPLHVAAPPAPVYLWVPPGHRKKWSKHCARYAACGVPVYFVQDGWYRQHVMPAAAPPPVARIAHPGVVAPAAPWPAPPSAHPGRGHGREGGPPGHRGGGKRDRHGDDRD